MGRNRTNPPVGLGIIVLIGRGRLRWKGNNLVGGYRPLPPELTGMLGTDRVCKLGKGSREIKTVVYATINDNMISIRYKNNASVHTKSPRILNALKN